MRSPIAIVLGAGSVAAGQWCGSLEPLVANRGLGTPARESAVFDRDGSGPEPARLYMVGGEMGGASGYGRDLVAWDGQRLSRTGIYGSMRCVRVFQDSSGAALYLGGVQGQLTRYDGYTGQSIPLPMRAGMTGEAMSMTVFAEPGQAPKLYVFVSYPWPTRYDQALVWRYDGSTWEQVGPGAGYGKLIAYDSDGSGPASFQLYQTSHVDTTMPSSYYTSFALRRWNGSDWDVLATGGGFGQTGVFGLAVYNPDGAGPLPPLLIMAGSFYGFAHGGQSLNYGNIGVWDGDSWSGAPRHPSGVPAIGAVAQFDGDGPGPGLPVLVAGARDGSLSDGLLAWDGTTWSAFGGGVGSGSGAGVTMLREFDPDGSGPSPPTLVTGGSLYVEGAPTRNFGVWDGQAWSGTISQFSGRANALEVFDDGSGRSLFAGGHFGSIDDLVTSNIARWNGSRWEALGPGVGATSAQPDPEVFAMAPHNDGSGWALYAAGRFGSAGGVALSHIARWDGQGWSRVGGYGLSGGVPLTLAVHDTDGNGPVPAELYAGGSFTWADGRPVTHLARWDGSHWHAVQGLSSGTVRALRSWDDGSGPALYVGGDPLSVGGGTNLVWKLSNGAFTATPALGGTRVNAFALHDSGQGVKLHAIGDLSVAGSPASVASLGGQWESLGLSEGEQHAARSIAEGSGRTLIVGAHVRRGSVWQELRPQPNGPVRAITPVFDDGLGPAVFFAGEFDRLGLGYPSEPASNVARMQACAVPCYANCDSSTAAPVLNVSDLTCFMQRFAAGESWANCDQGTVAPVLNVADFTCFLQRFAAGCP